MEVLPRLQRVIQEGPPWSPVGAADDDRATVIRRAAHRAMVGRYPRGAWWLAAAVKAIGWPVGSLIGAVSFARRRSAGPAEALGIWRTAMRHGAPPLEQYAYRIASGASVGVHRWMYHAETMHLNRALADAEAVRLCADKARLADHLSARGVPVPSTLALVEPGGAVGVTRSWGPIVVKPNFSFAGSGLEVWAPAEKGACWQRRDSALEYLDDEDLAARIPELAARHGRMLVQPLVAPHPRLALDDGMIPPVIRVVSGQWPCGRVEIAYAFVWHQIHEVGVARPTGLGVIDPERGTLFASPAQSAPAFAWAGPSPLVAALDGPLPDWPAAVAAVTAAHAALPGRVPMLSWDLLLSPSGPVLIEANVMCSLYLHQLVTGRPGTETILGEVFEAWLSRDGRRS